MHVWRCFHADISGVQVSGRSQRGGKTVAELTSQSIVPMDLQKQSKHVGDNSTGSAHFGISLDGTVMHVCICCV